MTADHCPVTVGRLFYNAPFTCSLPSQSFYLLANYKSPGIKWHVCTAKRLLHYVIRNARNFLTVISVIGNLFMLSLQIIVMDALG